MQMNVNIVIKALILGVLFFVVGCAMSGLIADSRTLIDRARTEAQVVTDFLFQTLPFSVSEFNKFWCFFRFQFCVH